MELTSFLIIDDHPLFREALGNAVRLAHPDARIFEAMSIKGALGVLAAEQGIDLALLDENGQIGNGERFARRAGWKNRVGIDAFRLAVHLLRGEARRVPLDGVTGRIALAPGNAFERTLTPAEVDGGHVIPLRAP